MLERRFTQGQIADRSNSLLKLTRNARIHREMTTVVRTGSEFVDDEFIRVCHKKFNAQGSLQLQELGDAYRQFSSTLLHQLR